MGFWIESASNDGSIGPDEGIHPRYKGMPSASSYNFILRNAYYTFYKISFVLKEVMIDHFKEVNEIDLMFNNEYPPKDAEKAREKWRELYERMKRLQRLIFLMNLASRRLNLRR